MGIKSIIRNKIDKTVRKIKNYGKKFYCPVCNSSLKIFLPAGIIPRPNARCPVCGSLERDRMIWLYLEGRSDLFSSQKKEFLHVAPEPCLSEKFIKFKNFGYVTTDLKNFAMIKTDITRNCFKNGVFDAIYCSHVLEHVEDDIDAMKEFKRVLKPGGWAILQVPIVGDKTIGDMSVKDPKERQKLYGQEDHVRAYGSDYKERLKEAGFKVEVVSYVESLVSYERRRYGLGLPKDDIYLCRL